MGEQERNRRRDELTLASPEEAENQIYLIRERKVMLDTDVAMMYEVDANVLIQTVRRNIERFPVDFVFRLSPQEFEQLKEKLPRPQDFARTPKIATPYAFTEEGVVMAAHYLKSPRAIHVGNTVVQDFVRLRKLCGNNLELAEKLGHMEERYDQQFQQVFKALKNLEAISRPPDHRQIGFRI